MSKLVQSGNAQLAVEATGDPQDPCVILVMGAQASLLWWPTEFVESLAARAHFVLRFDHRDTGLSTKYPVGNPGYTVDDLADDVIAVLDAFGVQQAQLLGVSMGGGIGQVVGLKYPDRISHLVLLSTSPLDASQLGLPGPTAAFSAVAKLGEEVDWNNRAQAVDYLVEFGRVLAGKEHFDESAARALIGADFDRAGGLAHSTNHYRVQGGEQWAPQLAHLKPPLTVLHGLQDPLFPLEHGQTLASAVDKARFIELPGGHGLGHSTWPAVLEVLAPPQTGG